MAGQFDFTSPGAAFGDAITQALVERKALERQSLLDSLSVKAEQRAEREADEMKSLRDYQISSGRQRDKLERLGALTSHMDIGSDPDALGWSPEDKQLGTEFGVFSKTQVPGEVGPDGASAGQPSFKYSYVGTQQQQHEAKEQQATAATIAQMQDPVRKQMATQVAAANNGLIPPAMQDKLFSPGEHLYFINAAGSGGPSLEDAATGKAAQLGPGGTIPVGGVVFPRPVMPPRYPNPPRERYKILQGPDGAWHRYDEDTNAEVPLPGGLGPRQTGNGSAKLNPTQVHNFGLLLDGFTTEPNSTNAERVKQSALQVINTSGASEKAKALARLMITDPKAGIVQMQQINSNSKGWSQADVTQLEDLLQSAWPKDLAQKYQQATTPSGSSWSSFMDHVFGRPDSDQ